MIDVILRFQVKESRGFNERVVLSIGRVWLFSLTSQDCSGAALLLSSVPTSRDEIRLSLSLNTQPANNDTNTVQADTIETAKFFEDAPVKSKEIPRMLSLSNAFGDTVMDSRVHDISNFLKRPILCRTGVWTQTDQANAVLSTMNMPADCLSQPLYREKLRGFYGFRAKMVIRLQINATRFQQGRLLLHYLPAVVVTNLQRHATAMSCLAMKSQQPCIDIACTDSEVIIEVPYISNSLYYSLLSGENPYGSFYITVYSPLVSPSGPTSVDFSVWCHFEDVEISYPTAALGTGPLMPQSGITKKKGRPAADTEIESVGLGPISGLANRVAVATGILSEIPLLSSITAPASWFAGVISRSAMALGYSKPTSLGAIEYRKNFMLSNFQHVDGVDTSQKLCLTSTNSIETLPGFAGSDLDEMSFAYLMKVPSYVTTFPWATTAVSQTKLIEIRVSPGETGIASTQYQVLSVPGVGAVVYTLKAKPPFQYIANMFSVWRGAISYTFKFVKTEFHSGRIMAVFTPGRNILAADVTFAGSQYCFKEIIDIRSADEYTVTIPFVSTTPYLPTKDWTGVLTLYVLNQLKCPDTVSSSISIIMEQNAGEDMEFAQQNHEPDRAVLTSQSGGRNVAPVPDVNVITEERMFSMSAMLSHAVCAPQYEPLGILYPQSLGTAVADNGTATTQVMAEAIDGSSITTDHNASRFITGERIMSVRQLIKRATIWYNGIFTIDANRSIGVYPDRLTLPYLRNGQAMIYLIGQRVDMVSYFGSMYAFQRGGHRIKIVSDMAPGVITKCFLHYNDSYAIKAVENINSFSLETYNAALWYESASQFGAPELEIPYNGISHCKSVKYASINVQSPSLEGTALVYISQSSGYNRPSRLYRAGADDLSFGFFFGCPLLCSPANTPYSDATGA